MKREIKFRIWNAMTKKMAYQLTEVSITIDGRPRFWTGDDCLIEGKFWDDKTMPLMQFAGVKDKDGRDIYEDDIVHVNGENRVIVWRECGFYCTWSEYALNTCWFAGGGPKVVGNIHENPELIAK